MSGDKTGDEELTRQELEAQESASLVGSPVKAVYDAMIAEDRIDLDPEGMVETLKVFADQAERMRDNAQEAERTLYIDRLGFGEEHLENSRDLLRKYQDKAIGGGLIAESSSMKGQCEQKAQYADGMWLVIRAALRRYAEQEGVTLESILNAGRDL